MEYGEKWLVSGKYMLIKEKRKRQNAHVCNNSKTLKINNTTNCSIRKNVITLNSLTKTKCVSSGQHTTSQLYNQTEKVIIFITEI